MIYDKPVSKLGALITKSKSIGECPRRHVTLYTVSLNQDPRLRIVLDFKTV